jgi:hypothetical protein
VVGVDDWAERAPLTDSSNVCTICGLVDSYAAEFLLKSPLALLLL